MRVSLHFVPVPSVSTSDIAHRQHRDAGHETGAEGLVPCNLPDPRSQDRTVGACTQAPPRGELFERVAHPTRADADDGRARDALRSRRPGLGR